MSKETFLAIRNLLDENKVNYTHLMHDHVNKSMDAAEIRDTNLDDAAKAIILKAKKDSGEESYFQCVIQASKRIDLKKIKIMLNVKNAALASPNEVLQRTGCTVGSVPPFANLFSMKIFMDDGLLSRKQIVFSAGTHTDSIQMSPIDYVKVVHPEIILFRKE